MLQNLVAHSKTTLLRGLETCLVDAVSDMGVDINRCITHDHYSNVLSFVSGLGLRKAHHLMYRIKKQVGNITNRTQFLELHLLGKVVYANCIGCIRVCNSAIGNGAYDDHDDDDDMVINPLDNTRIHPECYVTYQFLQKIVASALDVEMATATNHLMLLNDAIKRCRRVVEKTINETETFVLSFETDRILLFEIEDVISDLDIEGYAQEVEGDGCGKRLLQFIDIKNEIRFPFLDYRKPLQHISELDLFEILTNESNNTLFVGLQVLCSIVDIKDKVVLIQINDNNLNGFIHISNLSDHRIENPRDEFKIGMNVIGTIIRIMKHECKVEISLRKEHAMEEQEWLMRRNTDPLIEKWWTMYNNGKTFDSYFKESEACELFSLMNIEKKKNIQTNLNALRGGNQNNNISNNVASGSSSDNMISTNDYQRNIRNIYHPAFKNCSFSRAEEELSDRPVGEVIIRPSSKGDHFLSITWKFQEKMYKHIEIAEGERRVNQSISDHLTIKGESDIYSDLDEIIARFIDPMNELLFSVIKNKRFVKKNKVECDEYLNKKWEDDRSKVHFLIRCEEGQPGYFMISSKFCDVGIRTEVITLTPRVSGVNILRTHACIIGLCRVSIIFDICYW